MPVVAVFLDGLGADAIGRMPFLASQRTVRRMRSEFGYSVTCHASMYTGVRPDRHGLWFVWQRSPEHSPFRWLRPFRFLDAIDNIPMHVAATKVTRRFVRTTSWFGIPYPVHIPWRFLPELDVAERKLWVDPGYLAPVETIFDIFRRSDVSFEIVGMHRGRAIGLQAIEEWSPGQQPRELTYLFAGDIDHASHATGQSSDLVTTLLKRLDEAIARRFEAIRAAAGDAVLIVWSDHGHHDVTKINPRNLLAQHAIDLDRFLNVIDTNFIRVWSDDRAALAALGDRLNAMGVGRVLSAAELSRNRLPANDNRYGDLVFYLDLPHAFSHTIWGFGRRLASAHGYDPAYPGSDGVLVSNLPARSGQLELADVAPSLLAILGAPVPDGLDGRSIWVADGGGK
jgi:hypothetical protein